MPYRPVTVTLVIQSLDNISPFTAISYTWGPADTPGYIVLDDFTRLQVTENAFNALRSVTSPWRQKLVWMDSVCIN